MDFIVEVTDVYACCKKVVDFLAYFLEESPPKPLMESQRFLKTPLEIYGTLFKEAHLSEIIRYTRSGSN